MSHNLTFGDLRSESLMQNHTWVHPRGDPHCTYSGCLTQKYNLGLMADMYAYPRVTHLRRIQVVRF